MATSSRSSHGTLAQTTERQMRLAAIGRNVTERLNEEAALAALPQQVRPYVCISREAGSEGEAVARQLAVELGWQHLDRELIHSIAEREHIPEKMLQLVDEAQWNWLREVFLNETKQQPVNQSAYVLRLGEVLLSATRHASSVIVGRGAQFLLPRDRGIAVRIVAPRDIRVRRLMEQRSCSKEEAVDYLDRTDVSRDEFVQRYFHRAENDPHAYDMVINTGSIAPLVAANLIADLCRRKFPNAATHVGTR